MNSMAIRISWRGTAPPAAGPQFQVVKLDGGGQLEGVICSPSVWGVVTHWDAFAGEKGRWSRLHDADAQELRGMRKAPPDALERVRSFLRFDSPERGISGNHARRFSTRSNGKRLRTRTYAA